MKINPAGFVEIGIGIYFTLVGLGVIGVSKNPGTSAEWLKKYGGLLKIAAPMVLLYGLASTFGLIP